jgi:hypothetical protein
MATRDRITLAIALVVVLVAMIGSYFPLVAIPLWLFAAFLFAWGREPRRTEAFIGRLPGGGYIVKALERLDLVLSTRDQEYDQLIRTIVTDYDNDLRQSLRILWRTRNTSQIMAEHLNQFTTDGLIEYPHLGPGSIKPELRYIIERVLDELDVRPH